MSAQEDIKVLGDQACEAADTFIKLYYESFDKRRHAIDKLYMETASLLWNGNSLQGKANISKFLQELPTCEFKVQSLDTQPLLDQVTGGQTTITITVGGYCKFQGHKAQTFAQNFMLTSENNTWKIVSDCIRTFE